MMSFGLPLKEDEQRLTYGDYLKVNDLIALQKLLSDPPHHDEMLFIVIHQVHELWFKQLLHELDTIIDRLNRDEPLRAIRLLRRCIEIQRVLVYQIAVLETMTPMDFLAFRDHLLPASGFQSAQFREMEYVSGLKERGFMKNYAQGSDEYSRLEARLEGPSLGDAYYDLLRRRGFNLPEGKAEARETRVKELLRIYEEAEQHYDLFLLTESLVEYDEMFAIWRLRHIKMVERMIGSKTGTGGSEGASYLKTTVERKFFPELWELRTYMSKKAGGPGAGATDTAL